MGLSVRAMMSVDGGRGARRSGRVAGVAARRVGNRTSPDSR
jgi:hypothetical protein